MYLEFAGVSGQSVFIAAMFLFGFVSGFDTISLLLTQTSLLEQVIAGKFIVVKQVGGGLVLEWTHQVPTKPSSPGR